MVLKVGDLSPAQTISWKGLCSPSSQWVPWVPWVCGGWGGGGGGGVKAKKDEDRFFHVLLPKT